MSQNSDSPKTIDVDASRSTLCSAEPIHEETGEGIQAVLQELEDFAEKLRFKVDHVMTPGTNLHIYFKGKLSAYDAAVKAVRELQ
jgi:hypothetical protein